VCNTKNKKKSFFRSVSPPQRSSPIKEIQEQIESSLEKKFASQLENQENDKSEKQDKDDKVTDKLDKKNTTTSNSSNSSNSSKPKKK